MNSLENWEPCQRPVANVLEGRYVRLEQLSIERHGQGLFEASTVDGVDGLFTYLFDRPPENYADFHPWLEMAEESTDPLFYVAIDKQTGRIGGRQAFMRIVPDHGVIEIGNIYWGPLIAKRPAATEAMFLFAYHAFDALGYRRFEWKCDNENLPSRRAALRFGFAFDGVFGQHMVVKGRNRDTAWYAMLDHEWPMIKQAYQAWLDPTNFDNDGQQKQSLQGFMPEAVKRC